MSVQKAFFLYKIDKSILNVILNFNRIGTPENLLGLIFHF